MNHPLDSLVHVNLGKSVYAMLREALAAGRFQPNDRLRIRELALQLGTSVTPVRDAMLRWCRKRRWCCARRATSACPC